VRVAGGLITGKVVETRKGEPMEFLTFEDETGFVETTFFPQAYRRFCHLLDRERPYLLSGKVEEDWGAVTLTVESVSALTAPAETRRSEAA
jgi:DNA polymerase-3 subunit alpha/error-prone DNA polymerase